MSVKMSTVYNHLLEFIAGSIKDDIIDVIDEFFFDVKNQESESLPRDSFKVTLFFHCIGSVHESKIPLDDITFQVKDLIKDNSLFVKVLGETFSIWGPCLARYPEGKIVFDLKIIGV